MKHLLAAASIAALLGSALEAAPPIEPRHVGAAGARRTVVPLRPAAANPMLRDTSRIRRDIVKLQVHEVFFLTTKDEKPYWGADVENVGTVPYSAKWLQAELLSCNPALRSPANAYVKTPIQPGERRLLRGALSGQNGRNRVRIAFPGGTEDVPLPRIYRGAGYNRPSSQLELGTIRTHLDRQRGLELHVETSVNDYPTIAPKTLKADIFLRLRFRDHPHPQNHFVRTVEQVAPIQPGQRWSFDILIPPPMDQGTPNFDLLGVKMTDPWKHWIKVKETPDAAAHFPRIPEDCGFTTFIGIH